MKLKHLETITIPATTGKRLIKDHKELFSGYIEGNFENWGLDIEEQPKPETELAVMELQEEATFQKMLEGYDLEKCVMTQEQVIEVCENHQDKLSKDGSETFFLMKRKKDGEFFVARVHFNDDGGRLMLYVDGLDDDFPWRPEFNRRFVILEQALIDTQTSPTLINNMPAYSPFSEPVENNMSDIQADKIEKIELALYRSGVAGVDKIMKTIKEYL